MTQDTPDAVDPFVQLPSNEDSELWRERLIDILRNHARAINHARLSFTAVSATSIVAHDVVLVDPTPGDVTITIPSPTEWYGRPIRIKRSADSVNVVRVRVQGGGNIDDTATAQFTNVFGSRVYISNGIQWYEVADG